MRIKVTSSTYAGVRSKYNDMGKNDVSEVENAFLHINIVEVIFALKQCDKCNNLGVSAKPELMVIYTAFLAISANFPYHSKSFLNE